MTLAERARKLKEISPLMKGREKLETRDATGRVLTLMYADLIGAGTSDEYAIVVFAEEPDKFLFGGLVLTKLVKDLMAQLESEGTTLDEELEATFTDKGDPTPDAIKIKMTPRKGKSSNRGYTDVEVL